MQTLEVICPVRNEELVVPLFFERIARVFQQLAGRYECRLVFIDNASTDSTQDKVRELCEAHPWIDLIVMSRNFGYQCSVECGLRSSSADFNVVIDVDCEDPPELLLEFVNESEKGFDVVYGERTDREESRLLKMLRKFYYRFTSATADEHFILDMAEFCLISRTVRDAILKDASSFPFIRASIGRVGFDVKNVPYKRHKRIQGETHYNLWRMWVFAVSGILSSSTLWLRLPVYILPFWLAFSGVLIALALVTGRQLYVNTLFAGSLAFLVFIGAGTSLYLARVYKNSLQRPNFYINPRKSVLRGRKIT